MVYKIENGMYYGSVKKSSYIISTPSRLVYREKRTMGYRKDMESLKYRVSDKPGPYLDGGENKRFLPRRTR